MKIYANFIPQLLENNLNKDEFLKNKPITLFYDHLVTDLKQLEENKYNILFIQEPNQLFGFHDWTINNYHLFDAIFTWSESILNIVDNAVFFPFGPGDFEKDWTQYYDKKFEVSFMCGPKNLISGHHLRHKIFNSKNNITIPTKYIFEGIKDPCWNSMYHIAVENSQNKGYFTEKIIDAFLSKTIPIYWGCPNIGEFFDTEGIIFFNNELDLKEIVNNLTPDYYYSKQNVIEKNYKIATQYADFIDRINSTLKELCLINNI